MAQVARKLVSQKKKRYQKDGFDLDLACKFCVSVALPMVAQERTIPAWSWPRDPADEF